MKFKNYFFLCVFFLFYLPVLASNNKLQVNSTVDWEAFWITDPRCQNATNTWISFYKEVDLEALPSNNILAKIAGDSKYWLWINNKLAVFEGGLKRGPTPKDGYFDEVNLQSYFKKGKNTISVLLWYFGKDGFSHKGSGKAGFIFEAKIENQRLISDSSWKSKIIDAFEPTADPNPNFRLSESNVRFNANREDFDLIYSGKELPGMQPVKTMGKPPVEPWNELIKRPIPLWKDYGVTDYINSEEIPKISKGDTIVCRLPYNSQITPVLEIESPAGKVIDIRTDAYNVFNEGKHPSVRAEYITKGGKQVYESLGWMNGNVVQYYIPAGIKIKSLKYRETGYNSDFSGFFNCSDPFWNKLWQKAVRTLYVTMRDNYMDCPDRERAQWWGDMILESGEAFYALSSEANALTKKGIYELINWQRKDSVIYSPIPAGNFNRELPGQMLASVGEYGFWNYYLNTGDKTTIKEVYPGVKKYLNKYNFNSNGTLKFRTGEWPWGDWGTNKDTEFLYNAWYSLALQGFKKMAVLLGKSGDANWAGTKINQLEEAVNRCYWNGEFYSSSDYQEDIDDRSQAMAVLAGFADKQKYPILFKILQEKEYASPYMEKYVIEALFEMGYPEYGLLRLKKRFKEMVEHPDYTTLWEGWEIGSNEFGGGTFNHAWSGGGLTILSKHVAGISPVQAGFKVFEVKPNLGTLKHIKAGNEMVTGKIEVSIEKEDNSFAMNVDVPKESECLVYIPANFKEVHRNDQLIYKNEPMGNISSYEGKKDDYLCFRIKSGKHAFIALE